MKVLLSSIVTLSVLCIVMSIILFIDDIVTKPMLDKANHATCEINIDKQKIEHIEIVKEYTDITVNGKSLTFLIPETSLPEDKDTDRQRFQAFIKIGDIVNKPSFSDSICIIRNDTKYYWQLINCELWKDAQYGK